MEACKLMSGFLTRLSMREIEILDSIAEHTHCSFLDFLLPKITMLGNEGIFFILCAFVMLFFKKTRKTGIMMGVALLLGLIICNITIKPLVARTRPYDLIGVAPYLIKSESDYSFPSGHTTASFESAVVLLYMYHDRRRLIIGISAFVLAFIIAFSRLYLYVHYPTDVLFGMIIGIICGLLAVIIVEKATPYIKKKLKAKDEKQTI
jgi:undecaprenyl-diphosphatase